MMIKDKESTAIGIVLIYLSFAIIFAMKKMLWHPPIIWMCESLTVFFIFPVFIYDLIKYQIDKKIGYITFAFLILNLFIILLFKNGKMDNLILLIPTIVAVIYTLMLLKRYKQFKTFYLKIGRWKLWVPVLIIIAVFIFFTTLYLSGRRDFLRTYPLYRRYIHRNYEIIYYEMGFFVFMFAWEFLFRGFLIPILRNKVNLFLAVIISTVIFSLAHYGKPQIEIYSSIFGGIMLGYLTVYFRSIYPAVISHFILSLSMNMFVMIRKGMLHPPDFIVHLVRSIHP